MTITYVKFMTREEFISFIKQIRNFEMKDINGVKHISKRSVGIKEWTLPDGFKGKYYSNFKLNSFDFEDVLLEGSGYVRYSMDHLNIGRNGMLLESFGFIKEL